MQIRCFAKRKVGDWMNYIYHNRRILLANAPQGELTEVSENGSVTLDEHDGFLLYGCDIWGNHTQASDPSPSSPKAITNLGQNGEITVYESDVEICNIGLASPLCGTSLIADKLSYREQKITRNFGKHRLTGNESWNLYGGVAGHFQVFSSGFTNGCSSLLETQTAYCTHLSQGYNDASIDFGNKFMLFSNTAMRVDVSQNAELQTLEQWKSFLQNNEVWVYYKLQTPTYELINVPDLKTLSEMPSVLSATDGTVNASKIDVIYYKKGE